MTILGRIAGRVEHRRTAALALATVMLVSLVPAADMPWRQRTGDAVSGDPRQGWRPASEGGGTSVARPVALSPDGLPRHDPPPRGASAAPATRVREIAAKRTANARVFQLSDGRLQQEISAGPLHYRSGAAWRPIDTAVRPAARSGAPDGYAYANTTNTLRTYFGTTARRLLRLEAGGGTLTLGAPGARIGRPAVTDDRVTYADAFGTGVDLTYVVGAGQARKEIVLAALPTGTGDVEFTFTLTLGGLRAEHRGDGSIAIRDRAGAVALTIPPPFMTDAAERASSPYGTTWSDRVQQRLSVAGDTATVTIAADRAWLTDPARRYPVVIDPTVKIAPTPTDSQDTMVVREDDAKDTNYDSSWRLSVGTTALQPSGEVGLSRSLLRFALPAGITTGTPVDAASLQVYYDQWHTSKASAVTVAAHQATGAWTETGATWNNTAGLVGTPGDNTEDVDDGDIMQHAITGSWPNATAADRTLGIGGDYAYSKNATAGDKYTWYPSVTEPGDYEVWVHYVAGPDRSTAAPYTVNFNGGSQTFTVNQYAATAAAKWTRLGTGTLPFLAGTAGTVVLGDVADASKAVVADTVRLVKRGTATRPANDESSRWHSFSVRNIVQGWVNGGANHGFVLKAADESAAGQGGPRYNGSIYAYNGETAVYPRLVITYARPGVTLSPPTTIHATGAELSWTTYTDPCGFCVGDELAEYQVHRSVHQTFTPSAATLVAPVKAGVTTYTDSSAEPTAATDPDPLGRAYYYMVAVKTADGGLTPAPTQIVRLPKAGRTMRIIQSGVVDTTLSAQTRDTNHDLFAGQPWLVAGANDPNYGTTRAVLKFPTAAIPATARVVDAEVKLWNTWLYGPDGGGAGTFKARALIRDFVENQATWNRASTATAWTAGGGDLAATSYSSATGFTNDPKRQNFNVKAMVQDWVSVPASNKGLAILHGDETRTARAVFLSSEAAEPELRPQLVVTYVDTTPESTYYIPETPTALAAGTTATVRATVTNPTTAALSAGTWALSYRWTRPDGTAVTAPQAVTNLPGDVAPQESVSFDAQVTAPPMPAGEASKRAEHVLGWELVNKGTGAWFSQTAGNPGALKQNLGVQDPTSDEIGLEGFYAYAGRNTGGGGAAMANLHSGNLVWSYNAFTNPSRGLSTFFRMSYNSMDTSDSVAGFGWSAQASSVLRLGTPIDPHPNPHGREVAFTDGDGTTHTFAMTDDRGTPSVLDDVYAHPAGVHLFLQRLVDCKPKDEFDRAWKMTKPDRTTFYFDCAGYHTSTEDKNFNRMDFVYETRRSANQPTKFLRYIVDPAGRRTLTVDYWAKGDPYELINDSTWTKTTGLTNLTNPFIIDHIRRVTDVSGRALTFTYTDKGLLGEILDSATGVPAKQFSFQYDMTQGNKNVKLVKVVDPRRNATNLAYHSPPADPPAYHWWAKTITDRLAGVTRYAYAETAPNRTTTVTDAENRATAYVIDPLGRPVQATDAKNQVMKLGWDADHNVNRLEEPGGAVRTWTYDQKTGYPTEVKDAEAVANGTAGTILTYQTALSGNTAELLSKRSPEGRTWTFGYSGEADLLTVTVPAGTATTTAGDYTTTYTYDTWGQLLSAKDANGNTTRYENQDVTGKPRRVVDALGKVTTAGYDSRGNLTELVDPLLKRTTQTYDGFGRSLVTTMPLDQANNQFIVTPAPVYDANDNVTRVTAPNGAVTDAVFDAEDRMTSALAPKHTAGNPERRTSYTYTKVGKLHTVTEPKGTLTATAGDFTTTYGYDEIHRLTTVTNALGQRLEYRYDVAGNVATILDPRKTASPDTADFTTAYWYDRNHLVRVVFDALGKPDITEYDRDGLVKARIDRAGTRTDVILDARGLPVEVRSPHRTDGTPVTPITRFEYDQVGNRTKVISPRGTATANNADFLYQTVYDQLNRAKEILTPYDPADARYNQADRTVYSYDDAGRVTTVSAPPSQGQTVRNDTTYTYFDNGWLKSSKDPWDILTGYAYNGLGQQTATVVGAAGGSSSRWMVWDYHPDGTLKSRSDLGVPVGNRVALTDNSDFHNAATTGTWATATGGTGFHGYDYRTHATGAGTDTFEWSLPIPQDGAYDVFVRYPAVSGAATAAPVKVTHAAGTTDRTVNQQQNAGTWVNVGKYLFAGGTTGKVTLGQSATGTAVADAVKLVRDNTGETDAESRTFTYDYDSNGNLDLITDTSPGRRIDRYEIAYTELNQVASVREMLGATAVDTTALTYTPTGAAETVTHDTTFSRYEYDARDLVSKVTGGATPTDPASKITTYTYTDKGERLREVKGNGNTVDHTYYLDGLLRTQVERTSAGALVADHGLTYDLNGNRIGDASRKMNADDHGALVDGSAMYAYDPRDRVAGVFKATGGSETYVHDANDNVVSQSINGVATTFNYDRNRLLTAVTSGVTAKYNYDPFGRLDTVTAAGQVLQRKTYDGFDHVAEERTTSGGITRTTRYTYDPFDRTATRTTDAGSPQQKTTDFAYLGLSDEVLDEQVAGQVTKSYQYSPWGERLSQVTTETDGSKETAYYGYNPHSDVESLTGGTGATMATYGYTAYGRTDETQLTGIDKPDAGDPAKEAYNPYRFNAKRWDSASGDYDMGFRDYSPAIGRFLSRDVYNGALADLNLAASPFTGNRYAFGAGNPISNVELDGHIPDDCVRGDISCHRDGDRWIVRPRESGGGDDGGTAEEDIMDILPQIKDEILAEARRLMDDDPKGLGFCGAGDIGILFWGASGQGCIVKAGDEYGAVSFISGDWGWFGTGGPDGPSAAATIQTVYSTAENLGEMRGPSVCIAVSAGTVAVGAAAVCASLNADDLSDFTSVSVVTGVGLQLVPGVSGDVQVGYTGATELRWLESAVEGTVEHVDEATGWSAFWEAAHNPRAWMG
ncbi:DNRLRE domain-containing protein [Catellatospora sichuanensis]|uniref:golvesin C-terminal-like domain-containing protein n=1 Tax=Catellatospora sichuanensis TaxID=1969805 RepID=UPI0016426570|nr:DNRLRE domain-containing protein [Catellatospora sichuanensis]